MALKGRRTIQGRSSNDWQRWRPRESPRRRQRFQDRRNGLKLPQNRGHERRKWRIDIRDVGRTKAHGRHSGRLERLGLSARPRPASRGCRWCERTKPINIDAAFVFCVGIKWSEWAKRGLLFSSTSAHGGPTFETPNFHNVYLKRESKCSVKVG